MKTSHDIDAAIEHSRRNSNVVVYGTSHEIPSSLAMKITDLVFEAESVKINEHEKHGWYRKFDKRKKK